MTHDIFSKPNDTLLTLAKSVFEEHFSKLCSADPCDALLKTSQAVQNYYCVELHRPKQSEILGAAAPVGAYSFWGGIMGWFSGETSTEATTPVNQPKSP